MITLGLDTTGAHCTAVLVDEVRRLGGKSEKIGRGHAERLAPMVGEVLENANVKPGDIQRLSVCTGPGSFTGLRVALSFAKGFALPRRVPVIGISALECLAAQKDPEGAARVVSIMDVRRGEVCWAVFENGNPVQSPCTEKIEAARSAIAALDPELIVGNGAELIGVKSETDIVSGAVLAWLGQNANPENHPPVALYSRAPDAKLPGGLDP